MVTVEEISQRQEELKTQAAELAEQQKQAQQAAATIIPIRRFGAPVTRQQQQEAVARQAAGREALQQVQEARGQITQQQQQLASAQTQIEEAQAERSRIERLTKLARSGKTLFGLPERDRQFVVAFRNREQTAIEIAKLKSQPQTIETISKIAEITGEVTGPIAPILQAKQTLKQVQVKERELGIETLPGLTLQQRAERVNQQLAIQQSIGISPTERFAAAVKLGTLVGPEEFIVRPEELGLVPTPSKEPTEVPTRKEELLSITGLVSVPTQEIRTVFGRLSPRLISEPTTDIIGRIIEGPIKTLGIEFPEDVRREFFEPRIFEPLEERLGITKESVAQAATVASDIGPDVFDLFPTAEALRGEIVGGIAGEIFQDIREQPIKQVALVGIGGLVGAAFRGAGIGAKALGISPKVTAAVSKTVGIGVGTLFLADIAQEVSAAEGVAEKAGVLGVAAKDIALFSIGFGAGEEFVTKLQKGEKIIEIKFSKKDLDILTISKQEGIFPAKRKSISGKKLRKSLIQAAKEGEFIVKVTDVEGDILVARVIQEAQARGVKLSTLDKQFIKGQVKARIRTRPERFIPEARQIALEKGKVIGKRARISEAIETRLTTKDIVKEFTRTEDDISKLAVERLRRKPVKKVSPREIARRRLKGEFDIKTSELVPQFEKDILKTRALRQAIRSEDDLAKLAIQRAGRSRQQLKLLEKPKVKIKKIEIIDIIEEPLLKELALERLKRRPKLRLVQRQVTVPKVKKVVRPKLDIGIRSEQVSVSASALREPLVSVAVKVRVPRVKGKIRTPLRLQQQQEQVFQKQFQELVSGTKQVQEVGQAQDQFQSQSQQQNKAQLQQQFQLQGLTQAQAQTQFQPFPEITPVKQIEKQISELVEEPVGLLIPKPRKARIKRKAKQGYVSEGLARGGAKKGKWLKLNKLALDEEGAKDQGAFAVDESTSARFRIRPTGKTKKLGVPKRRGYFARNREKFRDFRIVKGKKIKLQNKYIEKRKHRIDTEGEKEELRLARLIKKQRLLD